MAEYQGKVWNGSEWETVRHMHVCTDSNTFEEAESAFQWGEGPPAGWVQLYKRFVPSIQSDSFNRPNGGIQSPWWTNGGIEIFDNAVRMIPNDSNGDYYAWAIHRGGTANTDRTFVEATLADTGSSEGVSSDEWDILPSWLILGADSTGQNSVFLKWEGSTLDLWVKNNGNDVHAHNGVSVAQGTGKTFRLERGSATDGPNVFRAYVDGIHKFTWTDTINLAPPGPARRYVGFGLTFNRGFFDDDWSPRLDNWSGGDQDY